MTGPTLYTEHRFRKLYGAVVLREGGLRLGSWECAFRSRPLARLSERRIYTMGENKGRAGYFVRNSGGVIPWT
jgi:hypothetical protein